MKNAAKKLTLSVKTELEFTVVPAPFQPSAGLDYIDLAKLASRRARLEVGEFTGGCCATKVYAIVERGMVTKVEFGKCKESARPPAALQPLLTKALAAVRIDGGGFAPVPIKDFLAFAKRRFIDIDIGGGCITICVWDRCYSCCVLGSDTLCGPPIVVKG
jgi:hypothetical protein